MLKTINIESKFEKLSDNLKGFVYLSKPGNYHVVINDYLSERKKKSILLEQKNLIKRDEPQYSYLIQ